MKREIPVACTLDDRELQKRRTDILEKIGCRVAGSVELENGFSYRLPAEDAVLQNLIEIINLERKCCPFLDFKLVLAAGEDFASMELTGPPGTKQMLETLFNWK